MGWRKKQLRIWPKCEERHQEEGQVVVCRSVTEYLSGTSLEGQEPVGGNSWVKGCKIFGFLCQGERLREGVEVGLQVGRPGRKECTGCEQVGVAELCVWVPRCGENLQVFWVLLKQGQQGPLRFHPRSWTLGSIWNQAPETQRPRSFCLLCALAIEGD